MQFRIRQILWNWMPRNFGKQKLRGRQVFCKAQTQLWHVYPRNSRSVNNFFFANFCHFVRKKTQNSRKNVIYASSPSVKQAKWDKNSFRRLFGMFSTVYVKINLIFDTSEFFHGQPLKGPYFENKNWRVNFRKQINQVLY